MRSIAILSDQSDSPTVSDLAAQLTDAGFEVKLTRLSEGEESHAVDLKEVEESSAVVAVVNEPGINLFIHLAYLLGRGSNVWIISKDINHLPNILRRASFIRVGGSNTNNILIDQIRERLQIDVPTADDMKDLAALVAWLREDTGGIAGLSSKHLERLVLTILNDVGLHHESAFRTPEADMVFSDPQSRTLVFVEVKSYATGQKLGVGTVERSVANALSNGCDFTVLVSPNEFTRAAVEYAKSSAPPVWLLGRDLLELWISTKVEDQHDSRKDTRTFFDRILKKPRGLLNKPWEGTEASETFYEQDAGSHFSGSWLASLIELQFRRLKYKRLLPEPETSKCEIFFSFNRGGNTQEVEQLIKLIYLLDGEGVRVWHDSPFLNVGKQCHDLMDVTMAARRCDLVFYFLGHGLDQTVSDSKMLQTLASEIARTPEERLKALIIGNDNVWNRLKLPPIFKECVFLDPAHEESRNTITLLCQRITQIAFSLPKEISK
jgi:hypothetical protein